MKIKVLFRELLLPKSLRRKRAREMARIKAGPCSIEGNRNFMGKPQRVLVIHGSGSGARNYRWLTDRRGGWQGARECERRLRQMGA